MLKPVYSRLSNRFDNRLYTGLSIRNALYCQKNKNSQIRLVNVYNIRDLSIS